MFRTFISHPIHVFYRIIRKRKKKKLYTHKCTSFSTIAIVEHFFCEMKPISAYYAYNINSHVVRFFFLLLIRRYVKSTTKNRTIWNKLFFYNYTNKAIETLEPTPYYLQKSISMQAMRVWNVFISNYWSIDFVLAWRMMWCEIKIVCCVRSLNKKAFSIEDDWVAFKLLPSIVHLGEVSCGKRFGSSKQSMTA